MPAIASQEKRFVSVLFCVFVAACPAVQAIESSASEREVTVFSQNKSKTTIALVQDANSAESASWLKCATKSYSLWQKGNNLMAMEEGEKATQLNPSSEVALTNLALMKQSCNLYNEAISLYRRVEEIAPKSWVPPLGIARCYIMAGDLFKGRSALRSMSERTDGSFDWYYTTAKTWAEIEDPDMAESTASKALNVASSKEQRSAAENLLFLARLRSAKFEEADSMREQVFHKNSPKEAELYVRAVASLLPVNDSDGGKDILNCAFHNLKGKDNAGAFFKLGRALEEKAADPSCDPENRVSWLESAKAAYNEAIKLDSNRGEYHFALAGALSMLGATSNAAEELKKSVSLDRLDILSPFLIDQLLKATKPASVNLSFVRFKINGLTCSCKLARVYRALKSINGVTFISTPPQKPYMGMVLVDHSLTPAREMIDKANQNSALTGSEPKTAPFHISLEPLSEESVDTIDSALKIASDIKFGPILSFPKTYSDQLNRFKEIDPIMPLATNTDVQTAIGWSAPF